MLILAGRLANMGMMNIKFIPAAFFFMATFIFSHASAQVDKRLIGKWSLTKIVDDELTMMPPRSISYDLTISASTIVYFLGINMNSIVIGSVGTCTEACCDEKVWKYRNRINYQGSYKLKKKGKQLIISNESGDLYLKKA